MPTGITSNRSSNSKGLTGLINVLDEGAKGNGVTDDAGTLNAIFANQGSALYVMPPGSYVLGSTVTPTTGACDVYVRQADGKTGTATGITGATLITVA